MLSNKHKKLIRALSQKKQRDKHQAFVAEGPKVIDEFIRAGYTLQYLFSCDKNLFAEHHPIIINEQDLQSISHFSTANACLAVFAIPEQQQLPASGLKVALDAVRDPGNLGTIIRLCDWFGISELICSQDTVDCYNPKVIQATMGSLARVAVHYVDLNRFLSQADVPIYGAFMDGQSIYQENLAEQAIIVMGNEANGIHPTTELLIDKRISIPRFGELQETESLNVATATAIILSEFKRG